MCDEIKEAAELDLQWYRKLVEVLGVDVGQDAVADGVARRIEQRVGHPHVAVKLLLGVNVGANHVLVDAQQVDDRMVLVHEDVRTPWNLETSRINEVQLRA